MEEQGDISGTGIVEQVITDPIPPADGADAKKPNVPAPGADDQKTEETPEQQEAKKESRRSRARERQVQELAAARTEARLFKERADSLEAQLRKPAVEAGEPKRESFDDDVAYVRAVAKYDAAQLVEAKSKADLEAGQRREQQGTTAAAQAKIAQDWVSREKAFQTDTPDYEQTVKPFVEESLVDFSEDARRLIVTSEVGPNLVHYLASNRDVADRILDLPPLRQVAELGKLEGTIGQAPVRKSSSAPTPPKPLNGSRSAGKGYSENMTDAEYKEFRKAGGARWAQR